MQMAAQIAWTNDCKIGSWLGQMAAQIAGTNGCKNNLLGQIAAQIVGTYGCKIGCWLGQMAAQIDGTNGCNIGCWDKSLHRLLSQMAAQLVAE